jgi:glycosyltransferase 2 family protein
VSTARRAGVLLAAALVAAFLVWGVAGGWSKAASYPWQVNWSHLSLAVVVLALFDLGWGMGYTRLIETLGDQRVQRRRVMSIWARSLLGRYVPGNVVMFAGRVVLGREAGISGQVSVAASAYEQVAMLVPAAVGATVFLLVANRSGWSPWYWIVVAVPFGVVVLDPVVLEHGAERLLKRFGRASTLIPLTRLRVAVVLGWFTVTMALLAAGTGLGVRAVAGARVGSVAYVGLAFLLSWVVAMVAFIFPSGLGVREGVFAVLLARHIPAAAAVSVAAASRLLLTAVELAVVASLVAAGRARR